MSATISPPTAPRGYGRVALEAPAVPKATGNPTPPAARLTSGWSMRELGQYRALKVQQRGDSWAIDAFFLHVPSGADPIQAAIRQKVDALRADLAQRVAKVTSESKVGKDFKAALAELHQHQQDAAEYTRQLERATAQRKGEALSERPSAAKLAKLDAEIAEASAAKSKAEGLVATIRPLVDERRKVALLEVEQVATVAFGKLVEELSGKRKTLMAAFADYVGGPLQELLVADQVLGNLVAGSKGPSVAAAMIGLAAPPGGLASSSSAAARC